MDPKQVKNIPNNIFTLYQKGLQVAKKNNKEYAIELLKTAVLKEPGFIEARKELRKLEYSKQNNGFLKKTLSNLKLNKLIKVGQMKLAVKNYKDALNNVEEALAIAVTPSALKLLAEVGKVTESDFITLEAYDLAVLLFPGNLELLRAAASLYREKKLGKKEVEVRKKIAALCPEDLKERMLLREAAALETMEKNDWENKEKSYRDKLKSEKESIELENKEKIIKDGESAAKLIEKYEEQLQKDENNIKILRELGDLYFRTEQYDKAIEKLEKLLKAHNTFDISVDVKIEKAKINKIQKSIQNLEEEKNKNPESEEEIDLKITKAENEINAIKRETALRRVEKFPNDMLLRYSLALIYWENGELDDAIEQFQLAQKNLNKQISSLIYLGRCFMKKGQYDIAVDQFQSVLGEPRTTTDQEFEALYYIGLAYEKLDKPEEAAKCFKKIYSTKSTYKDVAEILKRYY